MAAAVKFLTGLRADEALCQGHVLVLVTLFVSVLVGKASQAFDLFLQLDHLEFAPDGQSLPGVFTVA